MPQNCKIIIIKKNMYFVNLKYFLKINQNLLFFFVVHERDSNHGSLDQETDAFVLSASEAYWLKENLL